MDQRLANFISAVQTLHQLAGGEPTRVLTLVLHLPDMAHTYTVLASHAEPNAVGMPIGTMWVVLDPVNPYFLNAVKLKGLDSPDVTWVPCVTKSDALHDPQHYEQYGNGRGLVGPPS